MSFYPSSLIKRFYTSGDNEPISLYAQYGCLHPKRINFVDSMGAASSIYVPCGHCISCCDDRRNQLAARMFLHDKYSTSPWKHVYFITLTYGSYNLNLYEEHPFKDDWLATYPVLSSFNENKRPSWTPSILRQEHIVKFIKRLRQQNQFNTFSYVYCGEYGEKYFRPHFHLVLWSTHPVTPDLVRKAWSYKGVRSLDKRIIKPYRGQVVPVDRIVYCPIGHIKFVDLVANGSTAYKVKDVDCKNNAMHNFTYVSKYLAKQFNVTHPIFEDRLLRAYKELRFSDCTPDDENPDFYNNKIIYSNVTYEKFKQIISPFTCSSRSYSIGKGYALENLTRFDQGNFTLPEFRGVRLSFPSYFLELLNRKRFPLRFQKITANGFSFTKSNLPFVRAFFLAFRENKYVIHSLSGSGTFSKLGTIYDNYRIYDQLASDFSAKSSYSFSRFIDSIVWKDEHSTFYFRYSFLYDYFERVYYDRKSREYVSCDFISRESYCDMIICQIDDYIKRYIKSAYIKTQSLSFFDLMENGDQDVLDVRLKRIDDRYRHNQRYAANHITDNQ